MGLFFSVSGKTRCLIQSVFTCGLRGGSSALHPGSAWDSAISPLLVADHSSAVSCLLRWRTRHRTGNRNRLLQFELGYSLLRSGREAYTSIRISSPAALSEARSWLRHHIALARLSCPLLCVLVTVSREGNVCEPFPKCTAIFPLSLETRAIVAKS